MYNKQRAAQTITTNGHNSNTYERFLARKSQLGCQAGFAPTFLPERLFDFQSALVEWAVTKGRSAIFAGTGLGKTAMQLTWAENVVRHTNGRVLILAPVGVGSQTVKEGEKFGVECHRSRDGRVQGAKIIVTNYELLEKFDPSEFIGVVCDESSRLKHFGGATQKQVTRFMSKLPYRLLCTATPAPNDFYELGTSSEALGELGYSDMLTRFFKQDDHKVSRMNDGKLAGAANTGNHYAKLAYRVSQTIGQYHLKPHAEEHFWRWVCSWARICSMPSDLGFDDGLFHLPPLTERHHIVMPSRPPDGMLFTVPAFGLQEERAERRRTIDERCQLAADLVAEHPYSTVWCDLNSEGDALTRMIPHSVQVKGSDSLEQKEEAVEWFCRDDGSPKRLITKASILGYGLNLQHCAHVVTFASHSWERYYQLIRRHWRFGQHRPVVADVISTDGEKHVRDNMLRKDAAAKEMFRKLVSHSQNALTLQRKEYTHTMEVPAWL